MNNKKVPFFGDFFYLTKTDLKCHNEKNRYGQESGENPEQFYPCCESNEKSHIPLEISLGRGFE